MKRKPISLALIGTALLGTLYWAAYAEHEETTLTPQELLRRSNAYYRQTVQTLDMTTTETVRSRDRTQNRDRLYRYRAPDRFLMAITAGDSQGWAQLRTEKETLVRDGAGKPVRSIPTLAPIAPWSEELPSSIWMTNYIEEALRTPGCKYRLTRVRRGGEAALHLSLTYFRNASVSGRGAAMTGSGIEKGQNESRRMEMDRMEMEWWFRQEDGAVIEVWLRGPAREFAMHGSGEGSYDHHIRQVSLRANLPIADSDFILSN